MMAYALSIAHSTDVAEDAVIESFYAVFKMWNVINSDNEKKAFVYLRTSIKNKLIRQYHRNKKGKQVKTEYASLPDTNYDEQLIDRVMLTIHEEIERLPTERKKCFTMYYLEGKRGAEIAELLNLSLHTVRNQISKARNTIRMNLLFKEPAFFNQSFTEL